MAEMEVNPLVAGPDGVVTVDERAWNRRSAMGIRKSVGKNKKSDQPASAASVGARVPVARRTTRGRPRSPSADPDRPGMAGPSL
jgi:hypothetical protein